MVGVGKSLVAQVLATGVVRHIVFAFDEAAALCESDGGRSKYQSLLEALTLFEGKVFGIFLDTSSVVRSFAPAEFRSRAGGVERRFTRLFRPFYCFPSAGIFDVPREVYDLAAPTHPSGECIQLQYYPLLKSFASRSSDAAAILGGIKVTATPEERWALYYQGLSIIHRAIVLRRGPIDKEDAAARREEVESCLALSSIRWGMLALDRADPDSCVARRLATIADIGEDDRTITARYVGEPMLAMAAAMEMGTAGCLTRLLSNLFDMLVSGGVSGIFAAGDAGEFAAGVLLTCAYDRAVASAVASGLELAGPGMPIPVGSFLMELLGSGALSQAPQCDPFPGAYVCFLQILVIEEGIPRERLLHAFQNQLAFFCKKGQHGVDLVIPVARPGKGERRMCDLVASDMTAALIQVKNRKSGSLAPAARLSVYKGVDTLARKLFPPDVEYVTILASVSEKLKGKRRPNEIEMQGGRLRVVLSGIRQSQFPKRNRGAAEALKKIVKGVLPSDEMRKGTVRRSDGGDPERLDALYCATMAGIYPPSAGTIRSQPRNDAPPAALPRLVPPLSAAGPSTAITSPSGDASRQEAPPRCSALKAWLE